MDCHVTDDMDDDHSFGKRMSTSPTSWRKAMPKHVSAALIEYDLPDDLIDEKEIAYGHEVHAIGTWEYSRQMAFSCSKTSTLNNERRFKKLLCANRGEIAIRVFRAAHELGLQTVGIYSHEDRLGLHRYAADESYLVGTGQGPIAAYLDIDDIIRIAQEAEVDIIHPGYGFLAESAPFAQAVRDAGLIFVGPDAEVIDQLGDKTKAKEAAHAANVPTVPGTDGPCDSSEQARQFAEDHGLPVMLKAAYGGGGRGMRVVFHLDEVENAFQRASSEALAAFGNGTVFIERYLLDPQHIEVQILGDEYGNVIHLFERDCSIQRRHQKIVEMAPSQNLDPMVRQNILNDAVRLAKSVGYKNAGTVEFLVEKGRHYFIEVNPRIQVEHTVTEQITDVDLVRSQICIAGGASLEDLRLSQETLSYHGCAIQLRVTTEDPAKGFQPDTGKLEVYRSSGGPGIRLDSSTTAGAIIHPFYDSLLVKVTGYAPTFEMAIIRLSRALVEFRIRGVRTNIPFLLRLIMHPEFFQNRGGYTTFIEKHPSLFEFIPGFNRAGKLLTMFSDIVVNGVELPNPVDVPYVDPESPDLRMLTPPADLETQPSGWREIILNEGPEAFASAVRNHEGLLLMDTTWRDAHQSLLATRVRTYDIAKAAVATSYGLSPLYSIEMWGGATFDVSLRFLKECPWDRLDKLRALVPNIPFQMLLRGANAVGYTSYPDNVVKEFVRQAKEHGIDIFRVFDSLNYMENLQLGIEAIHEAGGVVEACICYTGDVSDPSRTKYNVDYYLNLVDSLVDLNIHILAIKDMAGLLKPQSAELLVRSIRERYPNLPIHVHTHDTAGTGVVSMLAAAKAGADVVDVAIDCMSGLTSQPSMGAIIGATRATPLDTGIHPSNSMILNNYWESVRGLYAPFESPSLRSGNSDVYVHEMPGGQYTNLQFQAFKLGLGDKWPQIKQAYAEANVALGDIVKVTPSSKVVGDLAQFMVQNEVDGESMIEKAHELSFPSSVVQFMQGLIGQPYGGFPERFRDAVLKGKEKFSERPGAILADLDLSHLKNELIEKYGKGIRDVDVISAALYPKVFKDFAEFRQMYGDVSVVPTRHFFRHANVGEEFCISIERGKILYVQLLAVGRLLDSGDREVFWELNGHSRLITVPDNRTEGVQERRQKCDPDDPKSIGAPMGGVVVEVRVDRGAEVKIGDPLVVLSAMKMETVVSSTASGVVSDILIRTGESLDAGDLLIVIS